MSHILLAANSKTGIFVTFPNRNENLSLLKREFSEAQLQTVTTKVKLHEESQVCFPQAALSCEFKGYDYRVCAVYTN